MTRYAGSALHVDHALRWDALPLGYGLGTDIVSQRTGEPAGAACGLFGLFQGGPGRVDIVVHIAHATLKAQLSSDCKYIFR